MPVICTLFAQMPPITAPMAMPPTIHLKSITSL